MSASIRTVNASDSRRSGSRRRRGALLALALAPVLSATLLLPARGAADSLYWSDSSGGALRTGNLNATGASSLLSGLQEPLGMALDPSVGVDLLGRIGHREARGRQPERRGHAADSLHGTGRRAADGCGDRRGRGQARTGPMKAAGRSWSRARRAAVTPSTLYTDPEAAHPTGIAVDSAAGKLYWTDEGTGEIREGALAGGAVKTLYKEPEGSRPSGIAVASSTSRLYWTDAGSDLGSGTVRDAPLSGSGEAQTLYTDPVGSAPRGLALDAASGAVYWGDPGLPALRTGGLTAAGSAQSLFAAEAGPAYPAVLAAPRGEGAPKIAGSAAIGQALTCENGTWASNAPGANFYQAPQTYAYQWQLNGANIAGAQSASFTPSDEGQLYLRR